MAPATGAPPMDCQKPGNRKWRSVAGRRGATGHPAIKIGIVPRVGGRLTDRERDSNRIGNSKELRGSGREGNDYRQVVEQPRRRVDASTHPDRLETPACPIWPAPLAIAGTDSGPDCRGAAAWGFQTQ